MALPPLLSATVSEMQMLSTDFMSLRLAFAPDARPAFTAGQYLFLTVPQGAERPVFRAYSIASAPQESDTVELLIRYVPGGKASEYIRALTPGSAVEVRLPLGHMLLDTATNPLLLVGVGSGVAPLYGIIRTLAHAQFPRQVTAYFGFRAADHAIAVPEMRSLAAAYPDRFSVQFCTDSDTPHQGFYAGRVTPLVQQWTDATATAYLCGMPAMVDEVTALLTEKGIPADRIRSEKY